MKIQLKDNEILFFIDFNNTLVDFENGIYDEMYDENSAIKIINTRREINTCLRIFEEKTGMHPVICVVTNASDNRSKNSYDYSGICLDLAGTFFIHNKKEDADKLLASEKCIRYVIHRENDYLYEVNPLAEKFDEMFKKREFSDEAKQIKYSSELKKRESVERFLHEVGPMKNRFVIFAGDTIQDDYPMKYAVTDSGVSRIFIFTNKKRKCNNYAKQKFCEAKGYQFSCVNPKNNKKIMIIDEQNYCLLDEKQKQILNNFDDGEPVIFASENSRGLCEGIYQAIDIINGNNPQKELN